MGVYSLLSWLSSHFHMESQEDPLGSGRKMYPEFRILYTDTSFSIIPLLVKSSFIVAPDLYLLDI